MQTQLVSFAPVLAIALGYLLGSIPFGVVLTSLGRAVAVVDSAERIDEDLRKVRAAARLVVESLAETAKGRSTMLNLDEVCVRLGVNVADVRTRSAQLQNV